MTPLHNHTRKGKIAYPAKIVNIAKTRAELLYPKENFVDYSNWKKDIKKVDGSKVIDFSEVYGTNDDR